MSETSACKKKTIGKKDQDGLLLSLKFVSVHWMDTVVAAVKLQKLIKLELVIN